MNARAQAQTTLDQPKVWTSTWTWVLAALLAAGIVAICMIGAARAIGDLESMQADVHRLNDRLSGLDAQFRRANGKLDVANRSMKSVLTTMRAMNYKLQSLDAMRADVHEVAHKFSGSFLFRGVK